MRLTPRLSWRSAVAALPLLLGACTVSQQGGHTLIRLDPDELTATRLQVFQVGTAQGVLRRTLLQQHQIKLYDRMKLIELGRIDNPRVVRAERVAGVDLIVVHAPTRACPHAHRLYELRGLVVGMWDINDIPGQCERSLGFASDEQSWMALQEAGGNERLAWSWHDGKLLRIRNPEQTPVLGRETDAPAGMAGPGPGRRLVGRFESGDTAPAPAPRTPAQPVPRGVAAKPAAANAKRAAPPVAAARKIDAGRYSKLPDNGVTEIAPAKVIMHDAN